jgi:hypothetical protein
MSLRKKLVHLKISAIAVFTIIFSILASSERPIGLSWDALYQFIDTNYTRQQTGVASPGRDVMICIMPDNFAQAFQSYAAWKHKSGTFVKIVKFSDIGATNNSASCSTAIKPFIQKAFDTWKYRPSHVLLVGDAGVFPLIKWNSPTEGTYMANNTTDEFFGETDSSNRYQPDILVGRLPVKDTAQMANMLKKLMNYERTPPSADTNWFKTIIAISSNQTVAGSPGGIDTMGGKKTYQAETVREVSKMQIDLGYTVDTLMCNNEADVDLEKVASSINRGCSYINYRGQGWAQGWITPCYQFFNQDVPKVQNAGMLPFITGIGCGITMFDVAPGGLSGTVTECFAEELLRLGTPSAPRGAIAVFGPPGETHSYWNNAMDKYLYDGIFQHNLWSPGQALAAAFSGMYKGELNLDTSDYLARLYLVLGDPSTHLWKDVPHTATVTGPDSVPLGTNTVTVTVKIGATPVKNAQVCVSGELTDSIAYASGVTDSTGTIKLSIDVVKNGSLSLVALGPTIAPVERQIIAGTGIGTLQNSVHDAASLFLKATYQSTTASAIKIAFSLPKAGQTTLAIYSLQGALVRTLASGMQSAGYHCITWNGRSDVGASIARGVYFVSLRQTKSVIRQRITKIE